MRAQSHLLIKGTQIIAALTFGTALFKQQTSHISNDDLMRHDPIKDIVERPQSESSPTLFHFPPALGRSPTISSIKSTTTIRSFLIRRGLVHKFYKQSTETWPQDTFTQEASTPSEDRGSFTADLESPAPKKGTKGDLSAKFDDCGDQTLESVRGRDAGRDEEDEGNSEADTMNEDLSIPVAFPIHRLAWQLHQQSISLFVELSSFLAGSAQLRDYENDLREDLGRLFLWGESFGDGRLDDILADSDELRIAILELCTTISKVLIEGESEEITILAQSLTGSL
jgi:hypothetical protein